MQPHRIIPTLDVAEAGHLGLGLGWEPAAAEQLGLEGGEEAPGPGGVAWATYRSHSGTTTRPATPLAECHRGILAALVAMVDDVLGPTLANSHLHRIQHQFGAQVVCHRPAVDGGGAPPARNSAEPSLIDVNGRGDHPIVKSASLSPVAYEGGRFAIAYARVRSVPRSRKAHFVLAKGKRGRARRRQEAVPTR